MLLYNVVDCFFPPDLTLMPTSTHLHQKALMKTFRVLPSSPWQHMMSTGDFVCVHASVCAHSYIKVHCLITNQCVCYKVRYLRTLRLN